jgi:signal peptidase I
MGALTSMAKSPDKPKKRHPWRENIEAISMAVVVALLFKTFVLEVSKIPSGSMQPTLIGNPESGVFDRVLVDKLSTRFRDPERWEIVVFQHPLERSRIMVKRLVGLPGEELRIEDGDLWRRDPRDPDSEWEILRRPPRVQRQLWRRLDPDEPVRSSWKVTAGGERWRVEGRSIEARGDGEARFRPEQGSIRDRYLDGYPDALAGEVTGRNPLSGRQDVGDLRVAGEVRALPGLSELRVHLSEGLRTYVFTLPGPAAPEGAAPSIEVRDAERPENGGGARAAGEPWRLPAGRAIEVAAENLDDRLALEVDGRTVAALEVAPSERQESSVTLALAGEGARLSGLQVSRDTYYLPRRGESWTVEIPAGHYVVLGDNTQDSADSRDWQSIRYSFGEPGDERRAALGNYRPGGENPGRGLADGGTALVRFRDRWGETFWIPEREADPGLPAPAPLVPRELLTGRAVAVFWPLRPLRGLWRLGWL